MASDRKNFYLGRQEKIFGPYDAAGIAKMRSSGEIQKFSYLWDPAVAVWKTIDLPPPVPLTHEPQGDEPPRQIDALCHDSGYSVVAGTLRNVTDSGCELVTVGYYDSPPLGLSSSLWMNLLDPLTRISVDLKVRMSEVVRQDGRWIFRVEWAARPAFL
jgi:hypothetical protein